MEELTSKDNAVSLLSEEPIEVLAKFKLFSPVKLLLILVVATQRACAGQPIEVPVPSSGTHESQATPDQPGKHVQLSG